jgi:LysR family transcriptional regulator, glycine cleavage system transcriptional activator
MALQAHTACASHKYHLCLMPIRPTVLPAFAVFAAAARHQNFAHAAEELHLTASAVSHHVRRLETTLGVTLFQRHARGVVLTAQGRTLADATNVALADLDAISGSLLNRDQDVARVRVTTLHSLAYCWLIPRLPSFTAAHPQVHLDFETSISLARFDDAGPDLGIRHGPGPWPGLTAHYLMDDALFPVAAPTLPGVRLVTKAAHIARLPLISDLGLQGWPDWFRAAEVRGANLPAAHSFTDSTDAMLAAVSGLGVALARRHIAAPYIERGELIPLPGPVLKAGFAYYVVHPAHRRPTPAAAAFIDWLRREAAKEEPAPSSGRGTSRSAALPPRAPASAGDRPVRKAGK